MIALIGLLAIVAAVSAVPTGGAAYAISSNNFTVDVGGASGDTWIAWGEATGCENWQSTLYTPVGGAASIRVYGAPLIGGTTVYYVACDNSGCDANERTVSIPTITTLPTPTFGNIYKNLTQTHFGLPSIPPNLLAAYQGTGVPTQIFWGIMAMCVIFGIWLRTRSVRMPIIIGLLLAPMIASMGLNIPISWQQIALGFLVAAIAGVLISFIRSK